jgi:hypothetical protein
MAQIGLKEIVDAAGPEQILKEIGPEEIIENMTPEQLEEIQRLLTRRKKRKS